MKTIIIMGSGQMGQAALPLINKNQVKILGFIDNNPAKWEQHIDNYPIMSFIDGLTLQPDCILIAVAGIKRTLEFQAQLTNYPYTGSVLSLYDLQQQFDIRAANLSNIAKRIIQQQIPGSVAELGVFRGDLAWQINLLFPDQSLYLFDTFESFDINDMSYELENHYSNPDVREFIDTNPQLVLNRMPNPERIILCKGLFEKTCIAAASETFSFVSLDPDLYAPTLQGLDFFYPRLSKGGMILLHDYNNIRFSGVRSAVRDFESKYTPLQLIPLCDLHGSAIIIK